MLAGCQSLRNEALNPSQNDLPEKAGFLHGVGCHLGEVQRDQSSCKPFVDIVTIRVAEATPVLEVLFGRS
jgi:hypothetical protein